MQQPKFLVLLAAYNGSAWISEQVETILAQVAVDVCLVVSDDGSTDDTRACLARYSGDSRVRITSPPRPTGSAAQNFLWLIRDTPMDGCEYCALADQDDIWSHDKLQRGCAALNNLGGQGYSCATRAFWNDGRTSLLPQSASLTVSDYLFEGAGQGCTYVLAAPLYMQLREFFILRASDTSQVHYHDWAIYALARVWRRTWIFDNQPMVSYRQHLANDTGARNSITGKKMRIARMRSGWYAEQMRSIARLCFAAAPGDPIIIKWCTLLQARRGITRTFRVVLFCLRGGRRRRTDRAILLVAALAGWI